MKTIIFLLFLLVKLICGNIDIWTYTERNIYTRADTLMTSLSYISSGSLHYITYIKNSKSYFYIVEHNKIIELTESIIISPLSINLNNKLYMLTLENNNSLYYVSNDILYKLNYNDTFTTRLRGMEFTSSSIALILLIGTNKIDYYYYYNNNIKLKTTYNLEYKIISFFGVSSYYDSGTVYIYYYMNETKTQFSKYIYTNEKFYDNANIILSNITLYNITEISKTIDNDNSILIFTYNKNDSNFYFYYYDYTDLSKIYLKSYGNKYNFWPFRDAKIINVFFLKNTEYLYYLIQKDNYYNAGVLDMENNLIIFNIQKVLIGFISIRNYNLVYGIGDTIYMVCPFNSKNPATCNPTINKLYIKISKDYTNTYASNACGQLDNYIIGRLCLKNIPLGYKLIPPKTFQKCDYFDIDSMECVDSCNQNKIYDSINGICYSCEHFNQYKYSALNKCVDDCSIYGLYSDNSTHVCIECDEAGLFIHNNKCVDYCDEYSIIVLPNICINCKNDTNDTRYIQYEKCVNKCDSYYILDDYRCYNCEREFKDKKYYFNNSCVSNCPNNTIKDDINKICYTCEEKYEDKKYYENGECVAECSEYYYKDIKNKKCLKCYEIQSNLFYQDGECVEKCSLGYKNITFPVQACFNCYKESQSYEYDGSCLSKCPEGTVVNDEYHICIKCKDNEIYDKDNNKCRLCHDGEYQYYLENKNSTFCFNCFCGYGNCLSNENSLLYNNFNNPYNCECKNRLFDEYLVFGQFCQYKYYINKNNFINIKPLQESIYINKRNIFTFELMNDKNNNLRFLLNRHEQNINRRIKYRIKWMLNDDPETEQNDLFYIINPGILRNEYNNTLKLTIFDLNNNIISEKELYIKAISANINNYDIRIDGIRGFYPMKPNFCPKILVKEHDGRNGNYLLNYKYITKDGEEFSLTGFVNNNYKYNEIVIPFSEKIKIEIKTDYNEIIYSEFYINFETMDNFNKTLSNIINEFINDNDLKKFLNELKNYFIEVKSFNYTKEENNINYIINITDKYLPLMIKYENNIINESNYINGTEYEIIEPNYFISLLNQISLFTYNINNNYDICEIYIKIISIINKSINNGDINDLNEDTILSLFRTIDNLITIMNSINCTYYEYKCDFSSLFDDFNLLKNIISNNMVSGSKVNIKGNNFNINLIKPGYYFEEISFNDEEYLLKENKVENYENEMMEYKDYKIKYYYNIMNDMKCNDKNTIFCIDKIHYDYLYDELTYLKSDKITNFIFSVTKLNNNNIYKTKLNNIFNNNLPKEILNYSYFIDIKYPSNQKKENRLNTFRYNISFDLPKVYEKNKSDIACIAVNSIIHKKNRILLSEKENCKTFFEVKDKKILCDCNTNGEILVLLDKNLAILSKKMQFSKKDIKSINCLSGSIILSSLALIFIFSSVLICFDSAEDKFEKQFEKENINKKVKFQYKSFSDLNNTNIPIFSLYLLYYKYSFLNIFSTYRQNHPRHTRYFIEVIKILLNLIFSVSPFYNKPFKAKNDIINERNIGHLDTENIPSKFGERFSSFFYSFIASIIIWIVVQIFYKILEFKKLRKIIWKPKEQILEEYIYKNIKKFPNFNKNFKKIKTRMLAYAIICGKNILDKKPKDKYILYIKQKQKTISNQKIYFPLNSDNINIRSKNNNNYKNIKTELALFPNLKETLLNSEEQNFSFSRKTISNFSERSIDFNSNKNLAIIKAITFSLLKNNSSDYLKINTVRKFELIKSKYISLNKRKDENKYNNANTNIVKYIDLELQSLKSFTYIPSDRIYKNVNILTDIKSEVSLYLIINAILFILLIILEIIIGAIFKHIYEEYENHIISSWLIPVIIQITINNLIINYLFALVCSYLLFNYYSIRKKKNYFGFVYNLIVEKYMIYFYKIRMLINKYNNQYKQI